MSPAGAPPRSTPGKDGVLDGDHRPIGQEPDDTGDPDVANDVVRDPAMRRRERRRLAVALVSTMIAIPMVLVEVAPGADASPDSHPAVHVRDQVSSGVVVAPNRFDVGVADTAAGEPDLARAVGAISGEELAERRVLATFSDGDALRAEAEAERQRREEEAARQAELEEQRRQEEARRAAEAEAAREAEAERRRQAEAEADAQGSTTVDVGGGPTPEQWHALRMCESSNNYQAVSPNGLYYGAYQFYQGTWDSTARHAGRGDLVGIVPSQAAPADQDLLARVLYERRGSRPWPHCGVHLR